MMRRELERADLITTIEQGRRVEVDLFQENSRGIRTMGELLKARVFGSTQWAIDLRDRMTRYVQGGGRHRSDLSAFQAPQAVAPAPPEPHPDLDAEDA